MKLVKIEGKVKNKKKKIRECLSRQEGKCYSCSTELKRKYLRCDEADGHILLCFKCLPEEDGAKKTKNIQKIRHRKRVENYRHRDETYGKRFKSKWKEKYKDWKDYQDFFKSDDWKALRKQVLNKYGRKCMCCGMKKGLMHVDHIKPRFAFPELELDFDNLQVLCESCNVGKGHLSDKDWRKNNK